MKKLLVFYFFISIALSGVVRGQSVPAERIAIMDFKILGNESDVKQYSWMATGFSETLSDAFSRITRFSVIERVQLEKVMEEQNLQKNLAVDTNSAVKLGKILGVSKILLGSCQITTGYLLVNMRIVNVETGLIAPIESLPIIKPIDSVLYLETSICLSILYQFKVKTQQEESTEIEVVTSTSTKSLKAYEFLNKGIGFYNNHQYEEAIQMYDLALGYDKKYGKAYYRRGLTNYALAYYDKAADDYSNATAYLKKDTIYYLMSNAYLKQGDYKKSLDLLKKAQKFNPNNVTIKNAIVNFSNNNLEVNTRSKPQKIDTAGYQTIFEFIDGIAKFRQHNKLGYIDTLNNIIIPAIFDDLDVFHNGLAKAKMGSKWGFINKQGIFTIKPLYTDVQDFGDYNLARVSIKDKWGAINTSGTVIIPIEFTGIFQFNVRYDSLVKVSKFKGLLKIEYIYGVYDITGKLRVPIIYEDIELPNDLRKYTNKSDLHYPYIKAKLNGKWGLIDVKNEILIPFNYAEDNCIREFKNDYAAVKVNERWGYVNGKGIQVITPQYDNVNDKSGEFFEVKFRGKWGLIDKLGNQIVPFQYDNLEHLKGDYWAAKKGALWGIVNSKNEIICDHMYDEMGSALSNYYFAYFDGNIKIALLKFLVKKAGKVFMINEKCKCIADCP